MNFTESALAFNTENQPNEIEPQKRTTTTRGTRVITFAFTVIISIET